MGINDCLIVDSIFKCKLVVDAEFPQKPPKGIQYGYSIVVNRLFLD